MGVLLLVPLYTRFLGNRLCGEWLIISSIVPYLALANGGVDQTLTNRIAEDAAHRRGRELDSLLSTVCFTYCGLSVVLVTAFALFSSKLAGVVGSAHDSRVSS